MTTEERRRVAHAMYAAQLKPGSISSFAACEQDALALELIDRPSVYRIVRATCRSKWCPRCAERRAHIIQANLQNHLQGRTVRTITLTLRHTDEPLATQVDRLLRSFRRLRSTSTWKKYVHGGAYFLELTVNQSTEQWHPHLHLIVDGVYFPHTDLAAAWEKATGDSHIVHIAIVRDRRSIARYVTKYLTKPLETAEYATDDQLAEAIAALHSRRICGCYGTWTKARLLAKPETPPTRMLGWMAELRVRASNGDLIAKCLTEAYASMPAGKLAIDVELNDPPTAMHAVPSLDEPCEAWSSDGGNFL